MKSRIIGVLAMALLLASAVFAQQPPSNAELQDGPSRPAQEHAVTPPKVSCHGNTLTISASYSPLGAILSEVQRCTGVQFDAPESAKASLVFDEIGPAPSNDVLASLLSATGFDYVIGASANDPEKIEKVVLLTRADEKDTGSPDLRGDSPARKAFAQMREAARPHTPEEQLAAAAEIERGDADTNSSVPASRASDANGRSDVKVAAAGTAPEAAVPASGPTDNTAIQAKARMDVSPPADGDNPAPPIQDAAKPERPPSSNEDRIANMQTLFEQRRQMMQQQHQQSPNRAPQ